MGFSTAKEIKESYLNSFGPNLGTVVFGIEQESFQLNLEWIVYRNLFDTNQERMDVMYKASGSFFEMVRHSLMITTIMRASRLLDPVKSFGKNNLTIQLLPALVLPEMHEEVNALVGDAINKFSPMKDWRNKLYAHNDLDSKMGLGTSLPSITPSMIKDLIDAIMAPIDHLNLKVRGVQRGAQIISRGNTERELLFLLYRALSSNSMEGYPEWLREDYRNGNK